jgi:hypothetical protein
MGLAQAWATLRRKNLKLGCLSPGPERQAQLEMTPDSLQDKIKEAIPMLLGMARDTTRNKISNNCKFILTEIKDSQDNFHIQRIANKRENDKKIPIGLAELMPAILKIYDNIYDINLHIYRSTKSMTVIDFRYYPKSSLNKDYREKVRYKSPMLHCKVTEPPWLSDKKEKFDVNWEHYEGLNRLRLFWLKVKLKIQST